MPEARESGVRVEWGSGKPLLQMVSLLIRFACMDFETAHPHRGEYGRRGSARCHAGGGGSWDRLRPTVGHPSLYRSHHPRRPAGHGVTQAGSASHPHLIAYFQ
jgi:hypothetical protein